MFSLPNSYSSLIIQHEAVAWSLVSTASPCKCSLTHQPLGVATRAASSHLTKLMVRASSHSSGPSAQLPLWLHKLSWANRIFVGTWQKKAASFICPRVWSKPCILPLPRPRLMVPKASLSGNRRAVPSGETEKEWPWACSRGGFSGHCWGAPGSCTPGNSIANFCSSYDKAFRNWAVLGFTWLNLNALVD